jgi:hypothetical protein
VRDSFYNYFYNFLYGLIPLFGGIAAIKGYREWGGLSTILGRAILFMGVGLFFWGCGEAVWAYYNFFQNLDIPYPSIADFFFAPSVLCYTIGAIFLARTTGVRFSLKNLPGKIFTTLTTAALITAVYYLFVALSNDGQLFSDKDSFVKSILDIGYPLGDALSLAVSMVVAGLSFKYLGGLYKSEVLFILFGLATMFAAHSYFSFTTTAGTSYNGDIGDLLFTFAVFFLSYGLLGFNKLKKAPAPTI